LLGKCCGLGLYLIGTKQMAKRRIAVEMLNGDSY